MVIIIIIVVEVVVAVVVSECPSAKIFEFELLFVFLPGMSKCFRDPTLAMITLYSLRCTKTMLSEVGIEPTPS